MSKESKNCIFGKCSCIGTLYFELIKENNEIAHTTITIDEKYAIMNLYYATDYFEKRKDDVNPYLPKNSSIFGDTINLTRNNPNFISSITIVNGKGIMQYTDFKTNTTWYLIE